MGPRKRTPELKLQKGITLVELSVALAIMTSSCTLLWQYIARQTHNGVQAQSQDLLTRAQKSLLAYATVHGRLPCPAQRTDGQEVCDGKETGRFPFLTTGLPDKAASSLLYTLGSVSDLSTPEPLRVLRAQTSASTPQCNSTTSSKQTCTSAQSTGEPIDASQSIAPASTSLVGVQSVPINRKTGIAPLALCQALGKPDKTKNLAFELHTDSKIPLGHVLSANRSVRYFQLLDHLHCQSHAMASAKAHSNATLATNTLLQGLKDFRQMKGYVDTILAGEVAGSAYGIANGIWTVTRTTPMISNAWSEYHLREGLDGTAFGVVASYTTVALDTTNIARQIASHARAVTLLIENRNLLSRTDALVSTVQTLADNTASRANTSALSGLLWTTAAATDSEKAELQANTPAWANKPMLQVGG